MSDREQLADAKFKRIKEYYSAMGGLDPDIQEDMRWLINRVEELEEREKIYKEIIQSYGKLADGFVDDIESLVKRNEHYKQALEFYANKINYPTFIENGRSNIEHDQGEKARQALGWEEEK